MSSSSFLLLQLQCGRHGANMSPTPKPLLSADDHEGHVEGCRGTYTPYRVNIWGLRKIVTNREEGLQMVHQQVNNILCHLKQMHNINKHLVTEDHLYTYLSIAVQNIHEITKR